MRDPAFDKNTAGPESKKPTRDLNGLTSFDRSLG